MTYGRLDSGYIRFAPRKLNGDGVTVYNPPAEMYIAQGWKPLTYTEQPEAPEGYDYVEGWEDTGDTIVQTWTLVERELDDSELLNILLGGDGE